NDARRRMMLDRVGDVGIQVAEADLSHAAKAPEEPGGEADGLVVGGGVYRDLLGHEADAAASEEFDEHFEIEVGRGQDELADLELSARVLSGGAGFVAQLVDRAT